MIQRAQGLVVRALNSRERARDSTVWPFASRDLTDGVRPSETYVCTVVSDFSTVQSVLGDAGYRPEWLGPVHYYETDMDNLSWEQKSFVRNKWVPRSGRVGERIVLFRARDYDAWHVHRYLFKPWLSGPAAVTQTVDTHQRDVMVRDIFDVADCEYLTEDYPRYAEWGPYRA